jgi:transposase-like protein
MANTKPIRRRHYSLAQRQEFVALYHQGQLSLSEFARRHDLKLTTLYQWVHHMKALPSLGRPVFKEVLLSAPAVSPTWAVELTVNADLTLRLGAQTSAEFIAQLVHHLRRPC